MVERVALWCVRCNHPAPLGVCSQCGSTETTSVRPEDDWGDPSETKRHGMPMRLLEDVLIRHFDG